MFSIFYLMEDKILSGQKEHQEIVKVTITILKTRIAQHLLRVPYDWQGFRLTSFQISGDYCALTPVLEWEQAQKMWTGNQ